MISYLTLIFACELAGELLTNLAGLPVPGPVCGMVILFLGLCVRGTIPRYLAETADCLLGNLSLLFIPAGVGIMLHVRPIGRDWLPVSVALVGARR